MESGEALDREVIVERAEELRTWLSEMGLSGRTFGALERELSGIIANDPGTYINGQRPLAGMTIDDFIYALHSRNAGAISQVKSVGDAAVKELRATIEPITPASAPPAPEPELPELEVPELELPELEAPEPEAPAPEVPVKRGRGRPKGSTSKKKTESAALSVSNGVAPAAEAPAPLKRGRGRPRRTDAPAPAVATASAATPARAGVSKTAPPVLAGKPPAPASAGNDMALEQLVRLWPSLHPHARRAVVLYASDLLAEPVVG